jgi:antitoxin component YwqK of YwqJK toxin-antitoxin module
MKIIFIFNLGISRLLFLTKKYSKLFLIVLLSYSFSCNSIEIKYFKDDNGIMYIESNGYENHQKPYTGIIMTYYSNGEKKSKYSYKDGKEEGAFIQWYENGNKKQEGTSINSEWNGTLTSWWENGQKSSEVIYKDDILIYVKGRWDQDGSERWTINSLTE